MAMFYDGDSYKAFYQLGDVAVTPREASDETLGYDQYEIDRHTFGSLSGFKRICRNFYTAMRLGRGQYLGFSNVKRSDIEAIDMIRSDIPKMTIRYDSEEEVLIMKFMAGIKHEIFAGLLDTEFQALVRTRVGRDSAFISMKSGRVKGSHRSKEPDNGYKPFNRTRESDYPSVVFEIGVSESLGNLQLDAKHWIEDSQGMKSGRVKGSHRSKEPDNGYKPFNRTRESDYPSVVFEIGVSESLGNLQLDAKHWIEDSQGKTRVVIIAAVNSDEESILIERWQDDPQGAALQQQPGQQPARGAAPFRRQQARNQANPNPYARNHFATLIQSLTLVKNQIYNGPSLTIPANLAYDNMPAGVHLGPNDFELDADTLQFINSRFWGHVM